MPSPLHSAFSVICVVGGISAAAASGAERFRLNDTGMTQCLVHVDQHRAWSPQCLKSGQDAEFGRDANHSDPRDGAAGFRFSKVCRSGEMAGEGSCPADPVLGDGPDNWGCVRDDVTKLTWEAKTNDQGVHDHLRKFTNKGTPLDPLDAAWLIDATNSDGLCGSNRWRLPDMLEFHSIMHYGMGVGNSGAPLFDPDFFIYSPATDNNWTSTVNGAFHEYYRIWQNDFGWSAKSERPAIPQFVRLVYGSARAVAKGRFAPSLDGTEVTDTLTGLVWRRCTEGMTWNNSAQSCDGTPTLFEPRETFKYARAAGKGWRVPNIKELYSIVDNSVNYLSFPSIDAFAFPNTPADFFYTSTFGENDIKWNYHAPHVQMVSFKGGHTAGGPLRDDHRYLRLVRRESQ
ncbi:MAG: DUF1566 domain-containing protein [Vitreoscilla sp.]|nr:DUF1566 domain-containing protein [Vitreoscilla sp.]